MDAIEVTRYSGPNHDRPKAEIPDIGTETVTVMVVPGLAVAGFEEQLAEISDNGNKEDPATAATALFTVVVVAPGKIASLAPVRAALVTI